MDIRDFVQMAVKEMVDAISGEYAEEQMRLFYGDEFDNDNDGHIYHYCTVKGDAANRICIVPPLWAV